MSDFQRRQMPERAFSNNYKTTDNGLVTESISDAQFTDEVKCKMLTNPAVLVSMQHQCKTKSEEYIRYIPTLPIELQLV